jgi:hypothetical protein
VFIILAFLLLPWLLRWGGVGSFLPAVPNILELFREILSRMSQLAIWVAIAVIIAVIIVVVRLIQRHQ